MKQFSRTDRLSEQIKRDVATVMESEYAARLGGMVTFTHVKLSSDLRYATVFYSVLGDDEARRRVEELLLRENGRIRHMVGANLRVKHIPEFRFKFDDSIEHGIRIEQLLNEIKDNDREQED